MTPMTMERVRLVWGVTADILMRQCRARGLVTLEDGRALLEISPPLGFLAAKARCVSGKEWLTLCQSGEVSFIDLVDALATIDEPITASEYLAYWAKSLATILPESKHAD